MYLLEYYCDHMDASEQLVELIASLKAAVTRAITAIDKLIAIDGNHGLVKERMAEFDQLLQRFNEAHNAYVDHLTTDDERSEAEEYWQKAISPVDEFRDIVGAWITQIDEHNDEHNDDELNNDEHDETNNDKNDDDDDDEQDDEYKENDGISSEIMNDKGEETFSHEQSLVEQTLQHSNASLEAKVHAVKRQQALEMEAFELESQELEERMKLERQSQVANRAGEATKGC